MGKKERPVTFEIRQNVFRTKVPTGGAHDALSDSLVPLTIPHPTRRLWHLDFPALGASIPFQCHSAFAVVPHNNILLNRAWQTGHKNVKEFSPIARMSSASGPTGLVGGPSVKFSVENSIRQHSALSPCYFLALSVLLIIDRWSRESFKWPTFYSAYQAIMLNPQFSCTNRRLVHFFHEKLNVSVTFCIKIN